MPSHHICISGDDLVFCAAHFITLTDDQCERLHGHTFRVATEIFAPLDDVQCVADFVAVRNLLKSLLAELDHRVLLPTKHPTIRVSLQGEEIEARHAGRRWIFPREDCLLLPMANTTAEMLAEFVAEKLFGKLAAACGGKSPERVRIEVAESSEASAVCELP